MCCYLYGANHAGVLRILSARSDRTAKFALFINAVGLRHVLKWTLSRLSRRRNL